MSDTPSWLTGLKAKRPLEWIRCLSYLIAAGLANGYVTANDIPADVRFDEPNVIGANFKDLRRFGFRKSHEYVKMTTARKHGREVPVWKLDEPMKAKAFIGELRTHLLAVDRPAQMEML